MNYSSPGSYQQVKEEKITKLVVGPTSFPTSVESQKPGENNPPSRALYLEPHSLGLLRGLGAQIYPIAEQGGKPGDESSPEGYQPRTL